MENQPLLPQTNENAQNDDRHVSRREKWRMKTGEKLESEHVHKLIILLVRVDSYL